MKHSKVGICIESAYMKVKLEESEKQCIVLEGYVNGGKRSVLTFPVVELKLHV